jgi:hypothetical protein
MALSKQDRITFSKKIVSAESEKNGIEDSKKKILIEKQKAYDLDQANKSLVDSKTTLIDAYHVELSRYNGILRTSLTETDIQDAADAKLGNFLYPNDQQNPPPSLAPQIWTKTKPYAKNKAVGKAYNENYPPSVAAEQSKITAILATITTIETYPLIQRVTGQECVATGTCSLPGYTTQATCIANGGVWTPGPDNITTNTTLQNDYNTLVTQINDLKNYVLTTQGLIPTNDPVNSRQTQNNTASANINTVVAAINAWLALTPFNTGHGQTTCAGFNSYNPALLGATRLQSGDLTTLKNAILARQTFVGTRINQIDTNLGSLTQNLSNGDVTGSGLYLERWNYLLLRLNFFGGSLFAYKNFDKAINAQNALQAQADLAKNTYSTLLTASILSAPSNGTKVLHVKNIGDFASGDNIFLVSDTQEEMGLTIASVQGNKITVDREVPAKYRPAEWARVYKDKT